jgi:hypothetical protein
MTTYVIYLLTSARQVCTKVTSKGRSEWRDVKKDKRGEKLTCHFFTDRSYLLLGEARMNNLTKGTPFPETGESLRETNMDTL